jgi:hypothetical protein
MVERGEDFGFPPEASQALGIGCERIRKHFKRDGPLQVRVSGAIYLAHATHSDLGDDFVRAEERARSQGHSGAILRDDS